MANDATEDKKQVAEDKKQIGVDYTGTLDDGSVFDSSEGKEPLKFVLGEGQVIKGFEDAVRGMKIGEEKEIHIKKDDAYGDRNEQMVQEVPKSSVPNDIELKEGISLALKAPTGQVVPAKVTKVGEENITLDLNHPLAGKDLNFKLKVVSVDEAPQGHEGEDCSTCGGC